MIPRLDDRGALTVYTIFFVLIILLFLGLAVDGSAKLRAGYEAVAVAQEAARAGAGQLDVRAVYSGGSARLDRGAAVRGARAYIAATGHSGGVSVTGPSSIRVTVTVTKPTWMLSMAGIGSVSSTATEHADLVVGVSTPS